MYYNAELRKQLHNEDIKYLPRLYKQWLPFQVISSAVNYNNTPAPSTLSVVRAVFRAWRDIEATKFRYPGHAEELEKIWSPAFSAMTEVLDTLFRTNAEYIPEALAALGFKRKDITFDSHEWRSFERLLAKLLNSKRWTWYQSRPVALTKSFDRLRAFAVYNGLPRAVCGNLRSVNWYAIESCIRAFRSCIHAYFQSGDYLTIRYFHDLSRHFKFSMDLEHAIEDALTDCVSKKQTTYHGYHYKLLYREINAELTENGAYTGHQKASGSEQTHFFD